MSVKSSQAESRHAIVTDATMIARTERFLFDILPFLQNSFADNAAGSVLLGD